MLFPDDWRADGFYWPNAGGTNKIPKKTPKLKKYYFSSEDKDSKREVYVLLEGSQQFWLIHYFGNEPCIRTTPHGNAKNTDRPFQSTCKSVLDCLRQSKDRPLKCYQTFCHGVSSHTSHVMAPRNVGQVKDVQRYARKKASLGHDEVLNMFQMAYQLEGYCKVIDLYPDLNVIFFSDALVREFIDMFEALDGKSGIYLGCDTTFNLGDFYVTVISCQHVMFTNSVSKVKGKPTPEPSIPLIFMLHERKFTSTHERLWSIINKHIPQIKALNIPVVCDREKAILNAIEKETSGQNPLLACWNHIKQDVKHWLHKQKAPSNDISVYIQHITNLLQCENEEEYHKLLKNYQELWSAAFDGYYTRNLHHDITKCAAKWNLMKYKIGNDNGITNNMSESINKLIKSYVHFRESTCDEFIAKMKCLQDALLFELQRGFADEGNYQLKREHRHRRRNKGEVQMQKCLTYEQLLADIKIELENDEEPLEAAATVIEIDQTELLKYLHSSMHSPSLQSLEKTAHPKEQDHQDESTINSHTKAQTSTSQAAETTKRSCSEVLPNSQDLQKSSPSQPAKKVDLMATPPRGQDELARQVLAMDGITAVPRKEHLFVVKSVTSAKHHLVTFGSKESCTCPARKGCYHIIAVKMSQGTNVPTPQRVIKLQTLAKRYKEVREGRGGRKKARPKDLDAQIEAAPDARLPAKKRKLNETEDSKDSDEHFGILPLGLEEGEDEMVHNNESTIKDNLDFYKDIQIISLDPEDCDEQLDQSDKENTCTEEFWVRDLDLTMKEQSILHNDGEWLNCRHMEACMTLLKREFPHIEGLAPTYYSPQTDKDGSWMYTHRFTQATGDAVQIHHNGSNHWVTSFRFKGEVYLLDSLKTQSKYKISHNVVLQLAALYAVQGQTLKIHFPDIMQQTRGNCGVHAIANAVYACNHKSYPVRTHYRPNMRNHLRQCFSNAKMTLFPDHKIPSKLISDAIPYETFKIHCPCRLPNFYDNEIQCTKCAGWFHHSCAGFMKRNPAPTSLGTKWFCQTCKAK